MRCGVVRCGVVEMRYIVLSREMDPSTGVQELRTDMKNSGRTKINHKYCLGNHGACYTTLGFVH